MVEFIRNTNAFRFTLPDGRILGYSQYGSPTGYPVLKFHGTPGSRALVDTFGLDALALGMGLRIIAVERPGYGLSTFKPGYRITDWPADVEALAKHLNLSAFAILAMSGGAPYALACARTLPRQTISAVGLMAGNGPPDAWDDAGAGAVRWFLPRRFPGVIEWVCRQVWLRSIESYLALADRETIRRCMETHEDNDTELWAWERMKHKTVLTQVRHAIHGALCFEQGTRGYMHDLALQIGHWGFEIEDVDYAGILLWHGTADQNVLVEVARNVARRLPHCRLVEFEGLDHQQTATHYSDILAQLVPEELRKRHDKEMEIWIHVD